MSPTTLSPTTLSITDQPTTAPAIEPSALRDDERQRCEVWTRVMGYHRPAASFNIGKQGEFNQRRYFEESPGRAC